MGGVRVALAQVREIAIGDDFEQIANYGKLPNPFVASYPGVSHEDSLAKYAFSFIGCLDSS